MNFLSHYYFEQNIDNPAQVLGCMLPDFLKNADKSYSFPLSKFDNRLYSEQEFSGITKGWERHVAVDKIFHSCDFFNTHTRQLRVEIEEVVADLPIRASFLAHVSLELLLDHNLIVKDQIQVENLYKNLESIDRESLSRYLQLLGDVDMKKFDRFYDSFVRSRYIFEYAHMENIPKALYNICKRIWDFEFKDSHVERLADKLAHYNEYQLTNYKDVYVFIGDKID